MMKQVDAFINSVTMYRLTLYGLTAMAFWAFVLSLLGYLSYPILSLLGSLFLILGVCAISNSLMAKFLKLPINIESQFITAWILFLILPPIGSWRDAAVIILAVLAAMASKYFLVFRRKHLFNPAAFGAVVMSLLYGVGATWWVGSFAMLPVTAIAGFLIVRKIHRFPLLGAFFAAALLSMAATAIDRGNLVLTADGLGQFVVDAFTVWPLVFFGTIMLTEPLTTPPTKQLQMIYGSIVGFIFGSSLHVGPVFSTPEVALVIGNLFTAVVTPAPRLFLRFKEKIQLTPDTYHFVFVREGVFAFNPGQYMEWMLPHETPDARGLRRYFTIASAPTERDIAIGVKVAEHSSTFKKALLGMKEGSLMVASQLAGDFTLPKTKTKKIVFIAGGIGITPFRSMVKALVDRGERRDAVLLYAAVSPKDFAYTDLWKEAESRVGLKTVYIATNKNLCPPDWRGYTGYMNEEMVRREVPDFASRTFYLSGPAAMVHAYSDLLKGMGVSSGNLITDYFPGF